MIRRREFVKAGAALAATPDPGGSSCRRASTGGEVILRAELETNAAPCVGPAPSRSAATAP
jgi:hypothetical protein